MKPTNRFSSDQKIAVDIKELQTILSVGQYTASKIGEEAGAVIRVGRRKLYNVKKIEAYMQQLTEV